MNEGGKVDNLAVSATTRSGKHNIVHKLCSKCYDFCLKKAIGNLNDRGIKVTQNDCQKYGVSADYATEQYKKLSALERQEKVMNQVNKFKVNQATNPNNLPNFPQVPQYAPT